MKHLTVLFKTCLILLLFDTASIHALDDSENCASEATEGTTCHKPSKEGIEFDESESEIQKSVFSEKHDCNLGSSEDSDGSEEGSCVRRQPLEDEDQSELSMLVEQTGREEDAESCKSGEEETSKGGELVSEQVVGDDDLDSQGIDLKDAEIADEKSDEGAEEMLDEHAESTDQDPDIGNVPLREILLKLKPEGLTDSEDDQPNDFSVTEASMGDDEEVEEEILVSSGSAEKQDSGIEGEGGKNGSGSSGINKKAICSEVNATDPVVDVEIINATLLMKLLQGNPNITNRSSAAPCHLVYFYSPYCPFSVAGSPYVNAMARSLRNIPVFGLDSIEHHSVNARYGVMGTPTLLLFHNGNGVGRYNASDFSVMQLLSFVNHYTDQSITDINVTSSDFRAALPSQLAEGHPYALWVSWIFLLSCTAWLFLTSELCARLTEAVLNNWREAEAQNDQD